MSHVEEVLDSELERRHHHQRARIAGVSDAPFDPPRSCNVVLNRRRFHYLDWGDPSGDPIMFLHGGGQTARTWDVVCHTLCQDRTRRAIALDQRGHGDSEWSYEFDYAPDAHARDLLALADHLELDRFVLVGMSMGCVNGLRFALDHPARVSSFVAVDAGPWMTRENAQPIIDFVEGSLELESLDAYIEHASAFNPRRRPELLRQSMRHNLRELPNGRWTWKTDWRRPTDFLESIDQAVEALQTEIHSLACPLLVVRGEESRIISSAQADRFAASVANGRWREITGAGHSIQGDQPKVLVAEIEAFLDECQ
ncbi:MAG: alpha/beta hydrolase [Polyangiales bacterium]